MSSNPYWQLYQQIKREYGDNGKDQMSVFVTPGNYHPIISPRTAKLSIQVGAEWLRLNYPIVFAQVMEKAIAYWVKYQSVGIEIVLQSPFQTGGTSMK